MVGVLLKLVALTVLTTACMASLTGSGNSQPNIVFILTDDMGWNDIGFNNPDIKTPHIDKLAKEGVILNQTYVQPVCSPSRAALMTSVYPYRMGLQHMVINSKQPVCAPLNRTLLPEVLQKAGYATHMIGKWHLGFCDWKCTPLERGFDSFLGFYNSGEDYFTKQAAQGYDFRDNEDVYHDNTTYSTFLFNNRISNIIHDHDTEKPLFLYLAHQNPHSPMDIPENYTHLYPEIEDKNRRILSAMVTLLDDSVGQLVQDLKDKGIYDNTLIVFSSDNGGWPMAGGNNYPLRGAKISLFEGGVRAAAFVHGPMFKTTGVRYDGLMHMVDWYPTLAEAAGADYDHADQDGVSQWQSLLSLSTPSKRNEVLYNLDLTWLPIQGRAAIRVGDWKLIAGWPGLYFNWYEPAKVTGPEPWELILNKTYTHFAGDQMVDDGIFMRETAQEIFKDIRLEAPWFHYLFNLKDDPYEHNNVYDDHPDIVKQLSDLLDKHKENYVPPNDPANDNNADPKHWDGNWSPGWCPNGPHPPKQPGF